jgi:hypothetical protein
MHLMTCLSVLQVDDQKVVTGCWDGTLKIVDSRSNTGTLKSIKAHKDAINCIQLLKDDRLLTGSYDGTFTVTLNSMLIIVGTLKIWEPEGSGATPSVDNGKYIINEMTLPVLPFRGSRVNGPRPSLAQGSPHGRNRGGTFSSSYNNNNNNKKCRLM